MKATDRHITCVDCGEEFVGHYSRERCDPCRMQYNKDYKAKWGRDNRLVDHQNKREKFWEAQKNGLKRTDREHTCPSCGAIHVAHYSRPKCDPCRAAHKKAKEKEYNEHQHRSPAYKMWLEKNDEKIKKKSMDRYWRNRSRRREVGAIYYQNNKERLKPIRKAWSKNNPNKCKGYKDKWINKNQEQWKTIQREGAAKRRALEKSATLPSTCNKSINKMIRECVRLSTETGVEYHVDHIIPLALGGAHHQENLRIITADENQKKHSKYDPSLGGVWADNDLARETKRKLTKGNK